MGVKQWQMSAKTKSFSLNLFSFESITFSFIKGFVTVSSIPQSFYFEIFKTSLHSSVGKFLGNGCMRDFEEKLPLIFQDIWAFSHVKAKEMLLI